MNPQGRQTITLREVTAQFAATTGYSVFEIVVWKPADDVVKRIPDANPTPAKTVWRAKVVVHEGRLTTEGELPQGFFTASTVTKDNPEVVYSLDSKDIVITLPAGANTDDLELFVRGDAGDESVVSAPKPATFVVVPKLNMQSGEKVACPPLNVPLGAAMPAECRTCGRCCPRSSSGAQ